MKEGLDTDEKECYCQTPLFNPVHQAKEALVEPLCFERGADTDLNTDEAPRCQTPDIGFSFFNMCCIPRKREDGEAVV